MPFRGLLFYKTLKDMAPTRSHSKECTVSFEPSFEPFCEPSFEPFCEPSFYPPFHFGALLLSICNIPGRHQKQIHKIMAPIKICSLIVKSCPTFQFSILTYSANWNIDDIQKLCWFKFTFTISEDFQFYIPNAKMEMNQQKLIENSLRIVLLSIL